jgi:hypothetical protein
LNWLITATVTFADTNGGDAGFECTRKTIFSSTFGDTEAVITMERDREKAFATTVAAQAVKLGALAQVSATELFAERRTSFRTAIQIQTMSRF